jgi:hypothetical protein
VIVDYIDANRKEFGVEPMQLTSPPSPDRFSQIWVVVVDHLIYFSWVSALLEMPSKSA